MSAWIISSLVSSLSFLGGLAGAYFSSYSKEKAKNLATKEDIGHITEQIEQIKGHFSKKGQRSEAYISRQILALDRVYAEIYKLRMYYYDQSNASPVREHDIEDIEKDFEKSNAIIHLVEQHGMYLTPLVMKHLAALVMDIGELIEHKSLNTSPGNTYFIPEEFFLTIEGRVKVIQECLKNEVFEV